MTIRFTIILVTAIFCCKDTAVYFATAFAFSPTHSSQRLRVAPRQVAVVGPEGHGAKRFFPKTDNNDYDTLLQTVETKAVHPDEAYASMLRLEKKSYREVRTQSQDTAQRMASNLEGDWRPIFSTGTAITQNRLGGRRVNYFPIKAVISFRTDGRVQNGVYFGDCHLIRITGWQNYTAETRKLNFGFHHMSLFNGTVQFKLKEGQDTAFAQAFGLGGHKGLWNILLADENMVMARGVGHGLTLWKREENHKAAL